MLSDAMSFTITAHFKFYLLVRMCLSNVVFPLPKNPLNTVTGSFLKGTSEGFVMLFCVLGNQQEGLT